MDLDVCKIQKILPHRFPFLLVDRVTIEDITAVGIKNVSINEWFFQGHFRSFLQMNLSLPANLFRIAGISRHIPDKIIESNSQNSQKQ